MPPKQQLTWNLFVLFSWRSFHFGMHMTCPAQCQLRLSSDGEAVWRLGCFVHICNTYISQYMWKTVFKRKQMFFLVSKKKSKTKKQVGLKKKKSIELKVYRCEAVLGVSLKQLFALSWHCCIIIYHLCELSGPHWGGREGKTDSQPAENTCRHANTTWEGAIL